MSTADMPPDHAGAGTRRRGAAAAAVSAGLLLFAAASAGLPFAVRPRKAPNEAEVALKKLQEVREASQKLLNSYDLTRTPVRIPIERAMALIADEAARSARDGASNP